MEEVITIPIADELNEEKLGDALKKYNGPNAVLIRNQGIFIWAEDWQKCKVR